MTTANLSIEKLKYAQRQRLTYIESVAYWEGIVDRPRISNVFSVSENHVTKDFRFYKEAFPGNIQYDEVMRAYRPTKRFKPRIANGSAEEYLAILRNQAESRSSATVQELATAIPTYALPAPSGAIDKEVLNTITRAISSSSGVEITYQSMNRPQPSKKYIWPHALLFSGARWHIRAYDLETTKYIDLVLQRIMSAKSLDNDMSADMPEDDGWNQIVEITVIPKRTLKPNQSAVVAKEFGMSKENGDWVWKAKMRSCVVGYFIIHHRLDIPNDTRRLIELKDNQLIDLYLPMIG